MLKIKRKNKKNLLNLLGIILIFCGVGLIVYKYTSIKRASIVELQNIELFFDSKNNINNSNNTEQVVINNQYMAILEIPKINLKKGLFDKNSLQNNVNKNIYVLKETILPDEQETSHILLAAHSGNSRVSFFNSLNKLSLKEKIYFYYKNIKYVYELTDIYEIEKTGNMTIKQSMVSDITLITCKYNTNKQVVYKATLINKENY